MLKLSYNYNVRKLLGKCKIIIKIIHIKAIELFEIFLERRGEGGLS
jgi:hypothetical protein